MWASVALLTALQMTSQPVNQLKITNDRVNHGILGWERKDSKSPKLLPGDIFVLAFDIDNLIVSPAGKARYSLSLELKDKANQVVFSQGGDEVEVDLPLGGTRLWAAVRAEIGLDTPTGTYTSKVTVVDYANKKATTTLTRTFDVVPAELGFVRISPSVFPGGAAAPANGVAGQTFMINFGTIGFTLDTKTKLPNLTVEMRVLDEAGKPVLEKPFTGSSQVLEESQRLRMWSFPLQLNRPGKFKLALKITDNLTKKSAEETLPFEVRESK